MGAIIDFLENLFVVEPTRTYSSKEFSLLAEESIGELWAYKLALVAISETIGSIMSKCEWKTYWKNEEQQKENWYLFNYEPNQNQTSCEFVKQMIYRLVMDKEVLIIKEKGKLYVASSFNKSENVFTETVYTDVMIDLYGERDVPAPSSVYAGENAIYIRYINGPINDIHRNMANTFAKLASNLEKIGSKKDKYAIKTNAQAMAGNDFDAFLQKFLEEDFKSLVSDKHAIVPLPEGFELENLDKSASLGQNASIANKSEVELFDKVMKEVACAYNVPLSFIDGSYEENDMDFFLTFCIDPLADLIGEAFNRKYYGKKLVLDGSYCAIDTKRIKHFDILSISNAINKIISSGVYTINEVRRLLDEKEIDDEIGDIHWITRNYAAIGEFISDSSNFVSGNEKDKKNSRNNDVDLVGDDDDE